jgi:hypothetical protein
LTRQLAQQAVGGSMKDVLDALRPPDLSRVSETLRTTKPNGPGQAEEVCAAILGQVQAMQKALREDDELVVLFHAGSETVRVLEFFVPQWNVVVLSGIDAERNITRVVSHIESVQLICKVMKVQPPAKPVRISFVFPRAKS